MPCEVMKVLFAPDWQSAIYQQLLAKALKPLGIEVDFLSEYKRILPFARGVRAHPCELIHLHWPEAYFDPRHDGLDLLRRARFRMDLYLGTRRAPLVVTAHNLLPHGRANEWFVHANIQAALTRAKRIIVHSSASIPLLESTFKIDSGKCRVILPGDLSEELGPPLPASVAGQSLGIPAPVCLMFGMVKAYKGIEGMISFWKSHQPKATLAIVGKPETEQYGKELKEMIQGDPNIITHFEFLPGEKLRQWLSIARCVIFNFSEIFNSGGAALARSYGIPILMPASATTINLKEPHPLVIRFEDGAFESSLNAALELKADYQLAEPWRKATSWQNVAKATAKVYEECCSGGL